MTLATTNLVDSGLDIANKYLTKDYVMSQYADIYMAVKAPALYMCGRNIYYQLGDGTTNNRSTVSPVTSAQKGDWGQVVCSETFTAALQNDGTLWAWGNNDWGQLGVGDTTARTTPTRIGTDNAWTSVDSSAYTNRPFAIAIKYTGTMWAWGANTQGQLGLGYTSTNQQTPIQIGSSTDWQFVSCGELFAVAIKNNGTMWAWGDNAYGQLGVGDTTARTSPTQIGSSSDWRHVSCGSSHVIAIKTDGTMWAWGSNGSLGYGALGQGLNTIYSQLTPIQIGSATDWKTVSAGLSYALALKNDGTMWSWGFSLHGQCGVVNISPYDSVPTQRIGGANWSTVSAGHLESSAIKVDGTLWTWGYNNFGQLGVGNTTSTAIPAQTTLGGNNWRYSSIATSSLAGLYTIGAQNDYEAYINLYSDLLAAWNNSWYPNDGLTKAQAGKRHWDSSGRIEGRTLPTKTMNVATGFRVPVDGGTADLADIFVDWNSFNSISP